MAEGKYKGRVPKRYTLARPFDNPVLLPKGYKTDVSTTVTTNYLPGEMYHPVNTTVVRTSKGNVAYLINVYTL